ncbi:ATP-binding protein [Yinghuangia seranimata]|uniref:ATP-binding protein n=1 Tax=Yinghuangia seranimata TaxID=408067 RepID=UPI00248C7F40|nr:ATP-binding protein [Yinghuangia seranimata]MDI2128210.1 ATP-binding protein [Yinghuangia seranimata]
MRLTCTPRGARLARHLVSQQLDQWGHGYETEANEALSLITAELAANAVTHACKPEGDFHIRLCTSATGLRVEVTDTNPAVPPTHFPEPPSPDSESGRGLLLVAALATIWGVRRTPSPGKTIWAEFTPKPPAPPSRAGDFGVGQRVML